MNSNKKQQIIDIIQWILIIGLIGLCCFIYIGKQNVVNNKMEEKQENTFIKIYESQRISELEKVNKALHDSIKQLKNVESAVEIRYKYIVKTDTIKSDDFILNNDSVYQYTQSNDTITTNVSIKASKLEWCDIHTEINDKFTIMNEEKDGNNKITIDHSNNLDITGVDTWHKKKKWIEHIYHGPVAGFGFGLINKKSDFFIGYAIGYKF